MFKITAGLKTAFIAMILCSVFLWPSYSQENVFNNGGYHVKYKGNTYYREMTHVMLGEYSMSDPGYKNKLKKILPDGSTVDLLEDYGRGYIYIYNDRIYMEDFGKNLDIKIYSVDLDGKNRKDYGKGMILKLDEKSGKLIYLNGKVYVLDLAKEKKAVPLNKGKGFIESAYINNEKSIVEDNSIYMPAVSYQNNDMVLKIMKYPLNGSLGQEIMNIKLSKIDKKYKDLTLSSIQLMGGDLFIMPVAIEDGNKWGSPMKGAIIKVNKKTKKYKFVTKVFNVKGVRGFFVNKDFLAYNDSGKYKKVNLKNYKDVKSFEYEPFGRGMPYFSNGEIKLIYGDDGVSNTVVTKQIMDGYGINGKFPYSSPEKSAHILEIELVDRDIYYVVATSESNASGDFDFKGFAYKVNIDEKSPSLLYKFSSDDKINWR